MAALGRRKGTKNAVLLDTDGAAVADFAAADGLAPARFAELVKGVRDVADDASRRMDAGALVRVEIEGPCGNVTVVRARGLTAALHYAAPLRVDRACEVLQDLVARPPAAARGAVRA
jgi:predicted regulator of Ras-like GTPase activity (Roadblock/LC7/MglB family)